MKAKIYIKFNSGKAVELEVLELEKFMVNFFNNGPRKNIKELLVKPIYDTVVVWDEAKGHTVEVEKVNPNADVKQTFPKGRW